MAGIYNNNNSPIPGNGADVFGDKLVGNQFVDGVSQFTLGNFEIKSNVNQKDSRDFSLGNFSEPISLETLNITSSEEAKILASNRLEVFINYSRSKITNFTLYGSLRERLKVAVNNVIKTFPAAIVFKKIRDWSDYNSGNTATDITFNANNNKTNINLQLSQVFNPFSIEYTKTGNIYTDENISYLRNLTLEYKKYSLFYKDAEYPLTFIRPTTGNTNTGILRITVEGNPFSGNSVTTDSFYLKPNTLTTEEVFDGMEDVEKYLIERTTTPIYTAKFDQPRETSTGKLVKSSVSVTWPSTDNWNLIINGGLFESYLNRLYDIADTYDSYKTNLVSRFLTTAALKEFDTYDEKVDNVLKIYGRSFDEIKKYIDGLAYMANVTYDGVNNIPNELLKNFAQTLGWGTPSAIKDEGFLDTIFKRNADVEYGGLAQNQTPTELNYELYRRLLANTAYLFKSKGTRRGIEFMLRFVGAPEALIEFNEHVYVAGQPLNMREFRNYELKISGGTYTEDIPVLDSYFSASTNNTFPAVVITGYTYGYETVTRSTNIIPEVLPVDKDGYPTIPKYGPDSYFQSGAGWFEETTEHQGKKIIDEENSVFTGNTPFVKTKLNQFSYGEPYLDLYRKFPDSKLGFPIVRTVDNKKSWVRKNSNQQRYLNLPDRGTNYQTNNDKLVINVKNVDIFLNVGQGLEWDVWNFSKKYSCPFGPNALSSPYPGVGGPDWTEIVADASKLSFFEFAQKFWTVLINVKNRQTIDDGHAGGYPTLLSIYLDYLKSDQTCGIPSNKYTYEKMIAYVENMGDYWVRLLEQLVPSTTIWQGGIKYENSIFHRYKYAYKHEPLCDDLECFGSFVHCCYPITNDILVDATLECGGLAFSGATWQNKITLGGTVYTGNTYYSSTTITDIPSTDIWLNDMVSILSGITTDVSDPNNSLVYYLINDNNTPTGIQIDQPNCIVIQGPCSGGTDMWNFNSGPDPHCFKSEICLTLQTTQVNLIPKDTDIWAFYDSTSTGGAVANAAKTSLDSWINSLGSSFSGNTYHLSVGGERWLGWASVPISGGTFSVLNNYYGNTFNVLPPGVVGNTFPAGISPNVLTIYFIDESNSSYHGTLGSNSCGYRPPMGQISDWGSQPTSNYDTDFNDFMSAFNSYDDFKGFIYPIIKDTHQARLSFPLHVYGALEPSTIPISDLIENPTVTAAGGTLSAITITNPYTGLTGTNNSTAYTGPGLENFGFGANYSLGADCNGLTCSDPGFQSSCLTVSADGFFDGTFQNDLLAFLQGSSDVTLNECEICIPICYREETETQRWSKSKTYNYGDIVLWQEQQWVWLGYDGSYTGIPGVDGNWSLIGDANCIPFLGGNDFRPHDDCDDFTVIPENPEVTGTTITTNPEIFKESIFNVGAQDCFESTYSPCEELADPCGCTRYVGEFDINTTLFEVGQVVCCPDGTKLVRIEANSCVELELFPNNACEQPNNQKCWLPCDSENVGNGVTSGGRWGKESVRRKVPSLISNSPTDPCDPSYDTLPIDPCACEGIGFRNIDLDFYLLDGVTGVPDSILEFFMEEDSLDPINWTKPLINSRRPKVYKAQINACCLGDKFTHYFRVYHRSGTIQANPSQITYGDYEIDLDVNQNCNIEFYHVTAGSVVKVFMHIPSTTITNNATISIIDNPLIGTPFLTQNLGASNFFNNTNTNGDGLQSLTFQIGKIDPNSNVHQFFKVDDSNFLTDNGTNSTNEETNDVFDRYWALDPFFGQQPLYGALTPEELLSITGNYGASPGFLGIAGYRFNWEMELSCQGQQTLELSFTLNFINSLPGSNNTGVISTIKDPSVIIGTPLQPGVGGNTNTVNTSGQYQQQGGGVLPKPKPPTSQEGQIVPTNPVSSNVPFTYVCGTDMSSPIINQNESASAQLESIAKIQNTGNLTTIPVFETITNINSDIKIENYTIVNSEMYIVSNFNPLSSNRVVNYNFPGLSKNTKEGLTYETFINNGRELTKLTWLDDFTKNGKLHINIEFVSNENKKRFEQDLKLKNVGQGVEFLPGNNKNTTSVTSTRGKSTFVDLRDWATRSLGNVKDFSNSKIIYGDDKLFKRFEVGPTFTTEIANSQYKIGTVPIGDPDTEFLISTMGSFADYIAYQSGTTSSALTNSFSGVSVSYSGYTNLSGYTDNQGLNISPDFVFDISLTEDKISYNSGIALSDPTFSETKVVSDVISNGFKLLGDERELRPAIPPKTLSEDNQLFFIPRNEVSDGGDYFYYKVPKTQNYRIQYKSCINFEYFDEGWCNYLEVYRNESGNNFPVNDYHFKQLINSSIIYAGGDIKADPQYNEGNVANSFIDLYDTKRLSPIFGYDPGNGIKDFSVNISVERLLSGTTATTVIGNYQIANNPTQHPNANEYLILPVNESDKFTDLYQCTGMTATTKIFEKKFTPYIDTGCIELNKDDEIRLKINVDWESTTKSYNATPSTSGLTATTISLKVGTDYEPTIPERPWFRIINKECNVPETTTYLYWQANEKGPVSNQLFSKGQTIQPTEGSDIGKLVFTNTKEKLDYVIPNIRLNTLQKLTYFDLPDEKNYEGNLKLIETKTKTNRWVKKLEQNKIKDFKIFSSKLLEINNGSEVVWNVPIPTLDTVESISLDDSRYTYLIESTVKVKGTENTFKILNTIKPDFKSDTTKDEIVNESGLLIPENITYTSSRPLEERTIGFENNQTIINGKIAVVDSVVYNKNRPTVDKGRTQYCKCGPGAYLAVPTNTTVGCDQWCCVNSYNNSAYYPCREKTINEWANGLNLTREIIPNPSNGIIRGL
jgi:hypothetical protein